MDDIGTRILKIRLEKGLKQQTVAKAAQISQPAYSKIESGQSIPRIETLRLIAKCLQVPMTCFFSDTVPNDLFSHSLLGVLWKRMRYYWRRRRR